MIRWLTAVSIVLASLGARPAGAQDLDSKPYESPDARVAAFDVALYNAQANVQEATDFEKAELATQVLLGTLGKLLPGQQITREEMLRMFTINNAYSRFQEDRLGSIEPRKQADFVVLDRDILTCSDEEVRTIGVLQTYVDGELVFEKA